MRDDVCMCLDIDTDVKINSKEIVVMARCVLLECLCAMHLNSWSLFICMGREFTLMKVAISKGLYLSYHLPL